MGPDSFTPPPLTPEDHRAIANDQVRRKLLFVQEHPDVSITSPRENGTLEHRASWTKVSVDPKRDGVVEKASHAELRCLLDYLEARFDRGDLSHSRTVTGQ
jgi:hypothetical protein